MREDPAVGAVARRNSKIVFRAPVGTAVVGSCVGVWALARRH